MNFFRFWLLSFFSGLCAHAAVEPPVEWIDPATGHRIVRLSREPGSTSFYFHQNAYSADGQKLVIETPSGLATVDLKTRALEQVVSGKVHALMTGRKTGQIYYLRDNVVCATDLDTRATREVAKLPVDLEPSTNLAINCDETMLVGVAVDPKGQAEPRQLPADDARDRLGSRWAAGLPMVIFTVDLKTGETRRIFASHDWLNHLQCSPTDPQLILFCHEGPWHLVDRSWILRTDGTGLKQIHQRTMMREIAGHEFFSADGKTIWYDLQTPRGQVFWLAGYDIATGARTWYHLERSEWSVHYNISHDDRFFAGDGGGPNSVAAPGNGQWIYLFRPENLPHTSLPGSFDSAHDLRQNRGLIKPGVLRAEKLVDLSKHDYHLEPNVTFSPDGQWIVFRSNMHGGSQVYAVKVKK